MALARTKSGQFQRSGGALNSTAPTWNRIAEMVDIRSDGSWGLTELGLARARELEALSRSALPDINRDRSASLPVKE
jgi:hypothetical protein